MIRVAIVGLGAVTRHVHLPAYNRLKHRCTVVAGCDPDGRARQWAAEKASVPAVYDNILEMLSKSRPDVVCVCTPPAQHREPTLVALAHSCHVFCEKPMAGNLAEADEMICASEKANRLLVINTQYPCMKIFEAPQRFLGSDNFGRLRYLHACQFMPRAAETGWRAAVHRRFTLDMGVHILELIRFFFGDDPVRISAHMPAPAQANQDFLSLISVEFKDGRAASMLLDRISPGRERFLLMRLDGEFASISISMESGNRLQTRVRLRGTYPYLSLDLFRGGRAVLERENRSSVIATEGLSPFVSGTARHFEKFIDAIENGTQPRCTAGHHRRTLALVFAAYDSAMAGRTIELEGYYQYPPSREGR